ncbi:MAG: ATP-dependent helicase HrpB [Gemmatimonadales bacterium]|nr:ATP-dependent helicase HrpB [Gemmatimonadales bacterium]
MARGYPAPKTPQPETPLPIDPALPELRGALRAGTSAVLQAPPGAGKTTRVPLALLNEPWLQGGRIVMLEPRRLAARAAARRMAATLGEEVGGTVGFRVRHETRVGPRTRIEVVTEGILTRIILNDPALPGIGLVVFDEFHERSLHADLGLALTLLTRSVLRDDLRVLVMSATLDGGPVASLLGGAAVVTSEGRSFPVETRHITPRAGAKIEAAVAGVVRHALEEEEAGDLLVFLPGAGEIRRVGELLAGSAGQVIPLHGNLPVEAQDRAVGPSPSGVRKVVLATSIAETSLTIEGVRVVVDSGLARVPRYSPRTGMTRLATVRVSRASADQRRGRAGRVAPGVCYRVWSEQEDRGLVPRATPEILEADLAPLALELAAAGVADPAELEWLDPPPAAAHAEARSLLTQLGALDTAGCITPHGRSMSRLAMHPRLAHMVLKGRDLGAGETACELAALLAERDVLRRAESVPDADIRIRLDVLRGTTQLGDVDHEALRRVRAEAKSCRGGGGRIEAAGLLLAFAYPDRIAQRRAGQPGRYLLRNGIGAVLAPQALGGEEYLVAAQVEGKSRESRILLAAPVSLPEIQEHFAGGIVTQELVEWDPGTRSVIARRRERLGALVLRESPLAAPEPEKVRSALLAGIAAEGIQALPWSDTARRLRARVGFVRRLSHSWPDFSDEALAGSLAEWLGPHLVAVRRWDDLARLDLALVLSEALGWERRSILDRLAPAHVEVPSGSRVPVDYSDPEVPSFAVRLQEMFGMTETPRVGGGQVPLTMHLLSPAGRPVQVTRDLAGFWRTTYFAVRKDLKGRYPRHYWPDDPLKAEPTRRVKPRGRPGNRG